MLSGHTLLVGCLVRLLFLRSVGIFPWCPHFILFRHLYRISDKECQKKQATPPSSGVFPDVLPRSVAEFSYKNNTPRKKLQGRAKRSVRGTGEWGESNGGTCGPVIALKACISSIYSMTPRSSGKFLANHTTIPRRHGTPPWILYMSTFVHMHIQPSRLSRAPISAYLPSMPI